MNPSTSVALDAKQAAAVLRLLDALEEDDDVQQVYANAEIPDDVLEFGRLTGCASWASIRDWAAPASPSSTADPGRYRWCTAAASAPRRAVDDAQRLFLLSGLITAVVGEYRPAFAAVERLFFSTNRTTAMRVSEARGVLLCALAAAGVPVVRVHAQRGQGGRRRLRRGAQAAGAADDPAAALGRAHRGPGRRRRRLRHRRVPSPPRRPDAAAVARRARAAGRSARWTRPSPPPGPAWRRRAR